MNRLPAIPAPVNTISGLNGALPKFYVSNWQIYTDLSQEQITAFQSFPEWATIVGQYNSFLVSNNLSSSFGSAPIPVSSSISLK